MEIRSFETHGRKLLVEFKCRRCKTTAIRTLEDCFKDRKDGYRDLYDLRPPAEWDNGGFYHPLLCPDCSKAYERFMRNER